MKRNQLVRGGRPDYRDAGHKSVIRGEEIAMTAKHAQARLKAELQPMRHLWPRIEEDLVRLGVNSLEELRHREPEELFKSYCAKVGREYDLCVQDTFASLVAFAKTGEPRAWWRFTRERSFPHRGNKSTRRAVGSSVTH